MIAARRRHKRFWVQKYEARDFDEDAAAANMLQQYEARMLRLAACHVAISICRLPFRTFPIWSSGCGSNW
jgi:hypothetical protein